ncbi:MAG TPA: polymer-forming cytoskeletal protein [Pseudolysinimonas sp.]|nr:polymer-forming cytoskeletal protein [Pseudolysinimonas sp.]
MLLRRRIARTAAPTDTGSALIPVIALVALGLIVGASLSTSVVGGLTFSGSTRAHLQSQAAADAGVAATIAGLYAGTCTTQPTTATYTSTGSVTYTATVQRLVNGLWQTGCPAFLTPQVKVLSTGRAVNASGTPYGAATTVEAVYQFLWPGAKPSGVGMYLYGGATVQANSSLDLSEGGLVIKKGNFVCGKNNAVLNGNVSVTGNLDLGSNSCAINGSAWVSGAVTLGSKGSVSGNLTSGSVSPNPPGAQVGGTYTSTSTIPATAPWTDIPYTPTDWRDSTGDLYQVVTLSGASCTQVGGWFGGLAGKPTIINALGCTNGIQVSNNTTFKLTSDVVIFAPVYNWGSINQLNFASSDTTAHRLWLMTPDNLTDAKPTCGSGEGDFAINNSFQIQAPISAMLYTPCAFNGKNGFVWRGQIYAGSYSDVENNPSFTFIPVGVAGFNLDTADQTDDVTTPQPGSLVSNRNVIPGS